MCAQLNKHIRSNTRKNDIGPTSRSPDWNLNNRPRRTLEPAQQPMWPKFNKLRIADQIQMKLASWASQSNLVLFKVFYWAADFETTGDPPLLC